jgi:glycerol-1-phosphate dehydrogenase [NAD(P)+]
LPLLARTVAAPIAIEVRPGAVGALPVLLSDGRISAGGAVAVVVGPGLGAELEARLEDTLPAADVFLVEGGSVEAAQELLGRLRAGHYDALVGIGGGRTLDVAKYAASMSGLPYVAVATSLAHDGLASPVASLTLQGRKRSYGVHIPIAVIVDIELVRRAPTAHLISGIGDVVSNLSAIADWELAGRERDEPVDGLAVALARNAAEAVIGAHGALDSEAFLTTLSEALIMSGLAMAVAGSSRPCSGACHEISHALDTYQASPGSHGTQVAVGALFASWLRGDEQVQAIDECFRRFGVPRLPADLGLSSVAFAEAVVRGPSTRPDRYTILEHLALDEHAVQERVDAFITTFDRRDAGGVPARDPDGTAQR